MTKPLTEEQRAQEAIDRAADKLIAAAEQIRREASASSGSCTDCKWYRNTHPAGAGPQEESFVKWWLCTNPVVATPRYDALTGRAVLPQADIRAVRASNGLCRPEGLLYESRPRLRLKSGLITPDTTLLYAAIIVAAAWIAIGESLGWFG